MDTARTQRPLVEGRDYYLDEQGLFVFTEAYHLARGYCCGSVCRHCPYPKEVQAETRRRRRSNALGL